MGKIGGFEDRQLIEAARIWTGDDQDSWPGRHDDRLVTRFGAEAASKLLPILEVLKADFYSSDARFVAKDLVEMTEIATLQFKEKHPEIPGEVADLLAWCYSFSNR